MHVLSGFLPDFEIIFSLIFIKKVIFNNLQVKKLIINNF